MIRTKGRVKDRESFGDLVKLADEVLNLKVGRERQYLKGQRLVSEIKRVQRKFHIGELLIDSQHYSHQEVLGEKERDESILSER